MTDTTPVTESIANGICSTSGANVYAISALKPRSISTASTWRTDVLLGEFSTTSLEKLELVNIGGLSPSSVMVI